ncbi:NADH dehydrogenase, alpha subcomplex, subunit 6 [Tilletiaria anomala UBC 951]|uniref:NADH dehydrogenase, alpha subcomplex, subunit 6 n=1 Tax=Tilletiaria anomala (strain ATCC 24038 / CBS 436.72 / UBC 951) TaxID=1037660 RepID=A0A066VGD8_TILAU|nr:NADH dehydrogenase, alpha subcomplex, subunit 6 [Tilletiaria anomala UBC 951]KDN37655.1 NADH dehydrogenase, alpha subcomplex, subunit 6 [Tilletiaria anomala UBC 951]
MTTIPARLAQTTRVSRSWGEAQARSRTLYRNWYRAAPEICALYALDVPPSKVRAKVRTWFEANKNIKDLAVVDVMLFKGHAEYQETMNAWKQIPHIMKWFREEEAIPTPSTFLERFYATRDEGRGPTARGL